MQDRPDESRFEGMFAWSWRLGIGVLCGMSYAGAILLVGWLARLVQGSVLHAWWRQSRLAQEQSFPDFLRSLGSDAPQRRPHWFLPIRSLVTNFWLGLQVVLATFLISGWGSGLMAFSWEFGWLNSFHKGHEQALAGILLGLLAALLFALSMLHVPLAATHLAVTGDVRAFFDFRFVWQLIEVRMAGCYLLAILYLAFGLVEEALKTAPYYFYYWSEAWTQASRPAIRQALWVYHLGSSAYLVGALLATRLVAARLYREGVLELLLRDRIRREDLHPLLAEWLDRLKLIPETTRPRREVGPLRRAGRLAWRGLMYSSMLAVWLLFANKVYVGEFFNYHPVVGFLNHPLVQLPFVNHEPGHLRE